MALDVASKLAEIEARYQAQSANTKANFLIYSRAGAGKTHLVSTAPGPILIHSFDPGGTRTIKTLIATGKIPKSKRIIIDDRFEKEVSRQARGEVLGFGGSFAYKLWEQELNELVKGGVFKQIGTYVIDSGTKWVDAMLNEICRQESRKYAEAQLQDYKKLGFFVADALAQIMTIPCNFIMTGHMEQFQDESDGKVHFSILATGKQKIKIPLMFDEFYYLDVQEKGGKLERTLLTQISGKHEARTRIGAGTFDTREVPDISALLKKAKYPWEDKKVA